jgi:hypothetical protein
VAREVRRIAIAILTIAVLAAIARLRPVIDPDVPWHLYWADRTLETGLRSSVDPTSFTEPGKVFENIQWLGELVLDAFWRTLGWPGLTIFAAIAAFLGTLATSALLFRVTNGPSWSAVIATALSEAAASFRFEARPQSLKLIAVPLGMSWAIDFARATDRRGRTIAAVKLAVLQIIWSQMHGSFVLLPAIAGIALLGELPRRGLGPSARALWLPIALSLSLFIAPAGLSHLEVVRSHALSDAAFHINEMRPLDPFELYPTRVSSFLWLDLVLVLGAIRSLRHRRARLDDLAFAILGLLLTFTSRRFRALWAILASPLAVRPHREGAALEAAPLVRFASIAAVTLVFPLQVLAAGDANPVRGYGIGLDRESFPADVTGVLSREGVEGNVLNEYDDGGWIELTLAPKVRIAIDGRTPTFFDEELFFRVRRATLEGRDTLRRFEEEFPLDLVLLQRTRAACTTLQSDPAWRAALLDRERTLFVKVGLAPTLPAIAAFDVCQPELSIDRACADASGADRRVAIARDLDALVRLAPEATYPILLSARFRLRCAKDPSEAIALIARALEAGVREPGTYYLLGEAFAQSGDVARAIEALDASISQRPSASALSLRGRLKLLAKDPRGARNDLERVIGELHDDAPPEARLELSRALLLTGDRPRAEIEAERAEFEGAPGADRVLQEIEGP